MKKQEKVELVSGLKEDLSKSSLAVACLYTGLTVSDLSSLRNKARKGGAKVRVAKNRLAKIALANSPFEGLSDYLSGQTILLHSEDEVVSAKIAADFAKDNELLVILGGVLNGQKMDAKGIKQLATLPSLDELRAKLLSVINAPATKMACVIKAPSESFARVISAYSKKS